jgi:hypothetical protein
MYLKKDRERERDVEVGSSEVIRFGTENECLCLCNFLRTGPIASQHWHLDFGKGPVYITDLERSPGVTIAVGGTAAQPEIDTLSRASVPALASPAAAAPAADVAIQMSCRSTVATVGMLLFFLFHRGKHDYNSFAFCFFRASVVIIVRMLFHVTCYVYDHRSLCSCSGHSRTFGVGERTGRR